MGSNTFERLYIATMGIDLNFELRENCLMFASCLDLDLTQAEANKLGILIWSRTSRGCNGFAWLSELYDIVLEFNNA